MDLLLWILLCKAALCITSKCVTVFSITNSKYNLKPECRFCARLIEGWGGRLGSLAGTEKGDFLMSEIRDISMDTVRSRVESLISKGYGKNLKPRPTEQQLRSWYEASMQVLVNFKETKKSVLESVEHGMSILMEVTEIMGRLRSSIIPALACISVKSKEQNGNLCSDFDMILNGLSHPICDQGDDVENGNFNFFVAIDADEELKLYKELDFLMDTQERAEAFKGNTIKFMAHSVQNAFRRIFDLENAFRLVSYFFFWLHFSKYFTYEICSAL